MANEVSITKYWKSATDLRGWKHYMGQGCPLTHIWPQQPLECRVNYLSQFIFGERTYLRHLSTAIFEED